MSVTPQLVEIEDRESGTDSPRTVR